MLTFVITPHASGTLLPSTFMIHLLEGGSCLHFKVLGGSGDLVQCY